MDRHLSECPVCASSDFAAVREATQLSCRIALCGQCGLLFANPTMAFDKFDTFYDDEFTGDAGSKAARDLGVKSPGKKASKIASSFAIPVLSKYIGNLKGLKLIEFRCRHAQITEAVGQAGASVVATDPMIENVKAAKLKGANALDLPISQHLTLDRFEDNSFDGGYALAVHVLAHLPDPVQFLKNAYRILKPGAVLVLDEKNIFEIGTHVRQSVFDSGAAHLFHLTYDTAYNMLAAAGFEVVATERATNRRSAFRHMILVARKPTNGSPANLKIRKADKAAILAQIQGVERKAKLLGPINTVFKKTSRFLRSLKTN